MVQPQKGIMKRLLAATLVMGTILFSATTPALAGWGIWQTAAGNCGIFEDGKVKAPDYAKQVENAHATYKDALARIQELLRNKTCKPKSA